METFDNDSRSLISDLTERKKELSCLYEVKQILRDPKVSLDQIFEEITTAIPPGWQFPDICKACIIYDGKTHYTDGFETTELKLTSKIYVEENEVGEIQVYYIKPVKTDGKPIFLPEERKLLNTISDEIGQHLTIRRLQELFKSDDQLSNSLNAPKSLEKWLSEQQLTQEEIEECLSYKISFKKGEPILKQAAFSSYIFILTKGLVMANIEGMSNKRFAFKVMVPYEIIGMSSLYGNGCYNFSVTALQYTEGYLVEQKTISKIIESNRAFGGTLLKWYSSNFELILEKLNTLANKNALGRIASSLLYLSNQVFKEKIIEPSITRRTIAELSGLSMESAVRILSELKDDGVITLSKQGIQINNYDLLRTFSLAG